ncbi:UvrB/UvrC motif-containing protein, partial [Candidatus Similichlamydia epinepheli]|uniref:UvrB/UvrC motif-containing protein n=1 Tax=Candidatus Similichlamydia epinepheli TaxID=1903953 RepID=UPI001864500E
SDLLDGKKVHSGRVPGGEVVNNSLCNKLAVLNEKLKTVLEIEDYEEAARIRDQIRNILGIEGQTC